MKSVDCVVVGEACADIILRPVDLDRPLRSLGTQHLESVRMMTGGIVPNAGVTLAKLGLHVAAVCVLGDDQWGRLICERLDEAGVETGWVVQQPGSSSVTAVAVGADGERSFLFQPGASQHIDRRVCTGAWSLLSAARVVLLGYYNLLPRLQPALAEMCAELRAAGCQTALDTANGGGTMDALVPVLPHLDFYLPNQSEAESQTGFADPRRMMSAYRDAGMHGLLGIKQGERGALLSPRPGEFIRIDAVEPPGPVLDTTGAGDCFYAGLLSGLLRGMDVADAGRLAAAAGACTVTQVGGGSGIRSFDETWALAQLSRGVGGST